jgi:activator of HSP90 ATPase
MSIHQEITFTASPNAVYEALVDAAKHAAYTGGVSKIERSNGGAFECHDGQIVGRNIELVQDERIVQAWRVSAWPEGRYSLVHFELNADGDGTRPVMDHHGVPDGMEKHIAEGWEARYWGPLKAFLG